MAWTKRQIIDRAFSALGLPYTFDKEPHEYMTALNTLDSMMAAWCVSTPLPYPTSNNADTTALDTSSNLPDWSLLAVWSSLAIAICSDLGKQVPDVLLKLSQDGKQAITTALALSTPQALSKPSFAGMGAGNQPVPNYYYSAWGYQ